MSQRLNGPSGSARFWAQVVGETYRLWRRFIINHRHIVHVIWPWLSFGQQSLPNISSKDAKDRESESSIAKMENGRIGMKNSDYLNAINPPKLTVTRSPDANDDENKERGNWSNKLEFVLSCLSYAVGLGNIWRFPYLCYSHGGGAFLIPYMIMIFVAGLPLFFLELAFGQYASEGPVTIWKISPLFQGIGYGMFMVSFLVGIYYNMIIAWTFFYLFSSFTSDLPWASCDNAWNTEACRRIDVKNCTGHNGTMLLNGTCLLRSEIGNESLYDNGNMTVKMPSDEYFHNYMLDISGGIHDLGHIRWQLSLCLLLAWILVYVALIKGVKSFGKLTYFTAFFPYVVMTILLIRAATLPGYMNGILFYVTPQWDKLTTAKVWGDAAVQVFFSLSPCWGGLITLSSYNQFHNNCFRDALVVGIINPMTSVYAGFVVFGIVGFMAEELGMSVDKVAREGPGLAFIAYPEAVTRLPLSPLWAILFFVMLLTLGLGTQFTLLETVVTTLVDTFPQRLRKRKQWVLAFVCLVMFLFGLILCTRGGMYMLHLMDAFSASYSTLLIGTVELFVIAWLYGVDRFMNDIKVMLKKDPFPSFYWKYCWKYITPLVLMAIIIFNWIEFKPIKYDQFIFPTWSLVLGWMLSLVSVFIIPVVAVYKIYHEQGPILERIKKLSKPTDEWGPKLQIHRAETDRPKHIDSQVPLAASQDVDDDDNENLNVDKFKNYGEAKQNGVDLGTKAVECVSSSYPPVPKLNISEYVINLDLPPEQRWANLSVKYTNEMRELLDLIKNMTKPIFHNLLIEFVDVYVPKLVKTLPYPFADEMIGISKATGMELGEIGLYNIFYELFSVCTSIVAQTSDGHLYHGRNLDFGIFMGWDYKTKTWKATDILRHLTVQLDFQKGGKTVFKSVNFVGYVGLLTGMKPEKFSISVDERFKIVGGYVGILKWVLGFRNGNWMSFLTRNVLENATSYEDAKSQLANTELLSPVYFILGGNQSGQAAVITRGHTFSDIWNIGEKNSSWYLVETNYDHWKNPPKFDDRRGPAKTCMNNMGQKNLSFGGLFDVLSTVPVLNKLTVYTALMEVSSGKLENYIQYCQSEDCPYI
ncbi:Solute carrier 6 [Chamberlinius hualienensis]